MTNSIYSAPSGLLEPITADGQRRVISHAVSKLPGWVFVLLVGLLFMFLILLGLLFVVSVTYLNSQAVSTDRLLDRGWALFSALALGWAVVNLLWARRAIRTLDPQAIYGHFAMAIGCGLIALGIHSVLFARGLGTQPIVMNYAHSASGGGSVAPTVITPAQGDAEEGRKIFSTTCITCHGPSGGGLPNLAPSLRGSPFVAAADDAAIANVIRLGRPVDDPANKTRKVMPARGGNPFLGDDKVVHLVAFVRAIQTDGGGPSVALDPNAPPPVQLAKWVVPTGPLPPAGMAKLDTRVDLGDATSITTRDGQRRQQLIQTLTLGLTGLHGLFLLGVMIASSNVLLRRLANLSTRSDKTNWELASLGWIVALVAWMVVFVYGFLWL